MAYRVACTRLKKEREREQVRSNNDAAFLCNFLFNIFFHFMDDLFPWNRTIDFKLTLLDFAIDFAIFTMWLKIYGWTDG